MLTMGSISVQNDEIGLKVYLKFVKWRVGGEVESFLRSLGLSEKL